MPALLERLTRQLAAKGNKNAKAMATAILKKRGHIKQVGTHMVLTPEGKKRQDLGNGGRAIDRAIKYSKGKHSAGEYKYNPHTNQATLKSKRKK